MLEGMRWEVNENVQTHSQKVYLVCVRVCMVVVGNAVKSVTRRSESTSTSSGTWSWESDRVLIESLSDSRSTMIKLRVIRSMIAFRKRSHRIRRWRKVRSDGGMNLRSEYHYHSRKKIFGYETMEVGDVRQEIVLPQSFVSLITQSEASKIRNENSVHGYWLQASNCLRFRGDVHAPL